MAADAVEPSWSRGFVVAAALSSLLGGAAFADLIIATFGVSVDAQSREAGGVVDFFETLFGWNLDGGSGAMEWAVVAAVVLAVASMYWLTRLRVVLHRVTVTKSPAAPRPARPSSRYALGREG